MMKKILIPVLMALFCLLPCSMEAKVVKVLSIGNSFSEDAVEQHLHDLAAADGIDVIIGNLYIGGCSLKKHLANAESDTPAYRYRKIGTDGKIEQVKGCTLEHGLLDEEWDYISFQQQSGQSGLYETWEASLPQLLEYVKSKAPAKTKFMLHQTWAYDQTSTHKNFKNYGNDQVKMYNAIVDAVNRASRLVGIKIVIPSGTAVQNARTTILKDTITRDGYHLHKTFGRYVAACTWFEILFHKNVIGNAYKPETMTEQQQLAAQKSAHAAVRRPAKCTKIK
jgi:hypothetical protein